VALTDEQKSKVRRYLGYPDVNRLNYHMLEGALDALSAEGETLAGALITDLDAMEALIQGARSRAKVLKAEEVTLNSKEMKILRWEAQRVAQDLANLLNVVPLNPPFSSGSTSGVARRG
jgi:hypothetical protein